MIPKLLHFVWVGDESRTPVDCIDTWRRHNPSYEVRVWGNAELRSRPWVNRRHIDAKTGVDWPAVADLMRYEILAAEGGLAFDADARCVRPLEDWLLEPGEFACWENEWLRPGLVANGYLGAVPGSAVFRRVLADFAGRPALGPHAAWEVTGPVFLTDFLIRTRSQITIYPSHYFIPRHYSGLRYQGSGQVFADQLWDSTTSDDEFTDRRRDTAPWTTFRGPQAALHRRLARRLGALPGRVRDRLGRR